MTKLATSSRRAPAGGPITWQLGAYYLNIKREVGVSLGANTGQGVIQDLYNAPTSANPTSQLFADRFDSDVYAVFGSADWEVSNSLDIGLALRYDIEKRNVRSLVPTATDPFSGGPINPGQAFGPILPQAATFKQLQPKLSIRWELADNLNAFANWGVGFKSGGFNNQGSAVESFIGNGQWQRQPRTGLEQVDQNQAQPERNQSGMTSA